MIRILHYLGSLNHGGAQSAVMNLYRKIDRSRIQFDFVTHYENEIDLLEEIQELGGRTYFIPPLNASGILCYKKQWLAFFDEHPEYKIFHCHMRSTALFAIGAAKQRGLYTIIHSHSTSNGSGLSAIVKDLLQRPVRYQADALFACSSDAGRWLFGKRALLSEKYHYLPNAIDIDQYAYNVESRYLIRSRLGIPNDSVVFGHVGRLHESKNHEFLLSVFAEAATRYQEPVLMLVGDGPAREQITQIVARLNLADKVILLGNRSDVPELLSAMDCFLFPSKWEGLPVTVVEALASGLPCLISDRITRDVLIEPFVRAFPIDDPARWVKALPESISRIDATERIKEFGFDVQDSADWLMSFYFDAYEKRRK